MSTYLKVALAEPSVIIRYGLEIILKRIPAVHIQLAEISSAESLTESLRIHQPDLLVINPTLLGYFPLHELKRESGCKQLKCIALLCGATDPSSLQGYDSQISLYDSADKIQQTLEQLQPDAEKESTSEEDAQTLSTREKEIVICVVKGMTNREIADQLFLSPHTVVTHRRNIARKLQIHSASGLTVYAIVNKLIELKDLPENDAKQKNKRKKE